MLRRRDIAEAPLPRTERLVVASSKRGRPYLRIVEERRRREVARCTVRFRTGGVEAVIPSPDGGAVALRWTDQTEAGIVVVELAPEPRQRADWETRETNWLEGPVWTPDSSLLVLAENPPGAGPWWAEHQRGEADDDDVSPGGTFTPGSLIVLDRDLRERFRRRLRVELPPGWFPDGDADRGLGELRVTAADEAVVRVPAEGDRRVELATPPADG